MFLPHEKAANNGLFAWVQVRNSEKRLTFQAVPVDAAGPL
jgi:hypothetical protein